MSIWESFRPPATVIKDRERRNISRLISALRHPDAYERAWAARALGELGTTKAVEALIRVIEIDDGSLWGGSVRGEAAVALGRIGDARAIPALRLVLVSEGYSKEVEQAAMALGGIRHPTASAALTAALSNNNWTVRKAAAVALRDSGCPEALEPLTELIKSEEVEEVAEAAVAAVGSLDSQESTEFLLETIVYDDRYWVQRAAGKALADIGRPNVEEKLLSILWPLAPPLSHAPSRGRAAGPRRGDKFREIHLRIKSRRRVSNGRSCAAEALGKMKCWAALEPLIAALDDPDVNVRCGAASGLGWLGHQKAVGVLLKTIETAKGPDASDVRYCAASALGKLGHPDAVQALTRLLGEGHTDRTMLELEAAVRALGEICHPAGFKVVESALYHPSSRVRQAAVEAIARFEHNPETVESLINVVAHHWTPEASTAVDEWLAKYRKSDYCFFADPRYEDDYSFRAMAAKALGKLGYSSSIPTLVVVLREDESISVRREAALALGSLRAREAIEPLTSILHSDILSYLGVPAARALGEIGDPGAIPALRVGLQSLHWDTYQASAEALVAFGDPQRD